VKGDPVEVLASRLDRFSQVADVHVDVEVALRLDQNLAPARRNLKAARTLGYSASPAQNRPIESDGQDQFSKTPQCPGWSISWNQQQ
jgi:hypothetical protein